jgi:hypothetical protein
MKYIEALKKYNEGSDKWCMPRKGSVDYLKIIEIMKKISNIKKSKDSINNGDNKTKDNNIKILQAAIKRKLIVLPKKNSTQQSISSANSHLHSTSIINNNSASFKRASKKPSYKSSSRVFSKDLYKNMKAIKIQKFLKEKLIINKYRLLNRINRYYLLKKKLSLLKKDDCLEKKLFDGEKGFTIRNIINLEKKIGSKSRYGSIYLTSIPNLLGIHPIASKIMEYDQENKLEVQLMTYITREILLKKLSKHFLMIYGYCVCAKRIAAKLRLVSINELADGDLKMLTNKREVLEDTELIFNLIFQIFISIATFQIKIKFIHRDAHYGNFLYQENNEKGYYHYIFNGKDYYLKSCKYNIMIFDYGFATDISKAKTIDIAEDYLRIIHSFINKKSGGWVNIPKLPPEKTNRTIIEITNKLSILALEPYSFPIQNTLFADIIEDIFLKYTPQGMFITQRPPNVINTIPFSID